MESPLLEPCEPAHATEVREPVAKRASARRWPAGRVELSLAERGGARELLRLPAALFGIAVWLRRAAYEHRLLPRVRLSVPVVSVGNLSTGGTGKTPFAAWIAGQLAERGFRPGLLSRGYGARKGEPNDEALLLARSRPDWPHVQDPNRARGGRALVARGVDAIVLDDGFQHCRLVRDIEFVLVDATRPWGLPAPSRGGAPVRALLPRGLLREPPSSLARADAILVTRCDMVDAVVLGSLEREISDRAPGRPIVRARHRPRALRDERGREGPVASLAGREVDLVSAIGNPEAFEATVRAAGALVREHRIFPDHHAYARTDLEGLGRDGRALVTTAKDAVKLEKLGVAFQALEIEIELASGIPVIDALLDALPRAHMAAVPLLAPRKLRG